MKRAYKILLLLLMLTLPLQSMAAATLHGAPARHGDGNSLIHPSGAHSAGVHRQHANQTPDSRHHDDSADPQAAACSAATTCCNLATTGAVRDAGQANPIAVSRIAAPTQRAYAGFIPEGPERPPRNTLC